MRKGILLFGLLFFLLYTAPAQAVTIKSAGASLEFENEGVAQFLKEHPDLILEETDWNYFTTLELTTQLTNRTLEGDFYLLPEDMVDHVTLMSKGFCLDLSGSEALMRLFNRLVPCIAEQLIYEGCLYAWPESIRFSYVKIDADVWEEAGLTVADIPDTFPAFLDFAEQWCERLEEGTCAGFHMMGGMDGYADLLYERKERLYTSWLLELLIHQVAIQQQYAGEEGLNFDDEDIQALIRRCVTVGSRLYEAELYGSTENKGLFVSVSSFNWPDTPEQAVYLRLNASQPKFIEAQLYAVAVNPATSYPDLCIELLEAYAAGEPENMPNDQYFYADAQPRLKPGQEDMIAKTEQSVESLRLHLEDETLSVEDHAALEDELARLEKDLQEYEENKWVVSPEALANYKASADQLYFSSPTILTETASNSQIFELREQVSSGAISVGQFIKRLCDITTMIQMEE